MKGSDKRKFKMKLLEVKGSSKLKGSKITAIEAGEPMGVHMRYMKPLNLFQDLLKIPAVERGRLLGLDVGDKYVGLAVSDFDNKVASPLRYYCNYIDLEGGQWQIVKSFVVVDDVLSTALVDLLCEEWVFEKTESEGCGGVECDVDWAFSKLG
ncbi:putative pre-16S rRNA nuclease isoform X1 [Tanacetum coccineum]